MIYPGDQLPLSLPVRIGEFQSIHRISSQDPPVILKFCPFVICPQQILKPFFQLVYGKIFCKAPDLLAFHLTIGHLNLDLFFPCLGSVNIGIAHGLGFVNLHRLFQIVQIHVNSFNLVNGRSIVLFNDPVGPPFHGNNKVLIFLFPFQRHFRPVGSFHLFLYFSVNPASLQHGLPVKGSTPPVVQISLPEYKLHQIPDRYFNHFFFLSVHIPILSQRNMPCEHFL